MYRYTEIVKSTFESQSEIRQISDFWEVSELMEYEKNISTRITLPFQFMEGEFLDGIYLENWYNDGDETDTYPCPGHPNVTG